MMQRKPGPDAAPRVVDRSDFDEALAKQIVREKALTRLGDTVSAARRRLPMVQVENYTFAGPDGDVTLMDLFGEHYTLLVQNFMFDPSWDEGCRSCSYAVDNLPANMDRFAEEGIAFALISEAPVDKLESWRKRRGWNHTWVSSGGTSYHQDWKWTRDDGEGYVGPVPGYSYYLLKDGEIYLTYTATARGTEAHVTLAAIMDRTCYGRQQDWEDSPDGWPQYPTYG